MANKKTRVLAAIMFTDMVGYTALMQENERKAKDFRDRHRKALNGSLEKFEGRNLQYFGDGTLSIFPSAVAAVEAAINIQKALRTGTTIPLRVGIHSGDITYDDEGIYGDGVNVASRIESLALPGSILISEKIFDDIKNQPNLTASSLGFFSFKNVKQSLEVFAVTGPELFVPSRTELKGKLEDRYESIAVLPFVNMSNDPENEYFSDGITEEIINGLTRIKGLKVTSRTSSFSFKGQNEDIRRIAQQLNVSTLLEGSVRKAGNKVRVTAQLINARDGYHIWSDHFDGHMEDIFALQDDITEKIVNHLRSQLVPSDGAPGQKKVYRDQNPKAYQLYLKGLFYLNKWSPDDALRAAKYLHQSVDQDPDFALPHSRLAYGYTYLSAMGKISSSESYEKARFHGETAIRLDPTNGIAHSSMGLLQMFYLKDFKKSKELLNRAILLNPGSAEVHNAYAFYLIATEDYAEALNECTIAHELDPLSLIHHQALGYTYFLLDQVEKAEAITEEIFERDPDYRPTIELKSMIHIKRREYEEAIGVALRLQKLLNDPRKGITVLGLAYALNGNREEALELIDRLKERQKTQSGSLAMDMAIIYAGLRDKDMAFAYLDKAIEANTGGMVFIRTNYGLYNLGEDERLQAMIRKIGLPV